MQFGHVLVFMDLSSRSFFAAMEMTLPSARVPVHAFAFMFAWMAIQSATHMSGTGQHSPSDHLKQGTLVSFFIWVVLTECVCVCVLALKSGNPTETSIEFPAGR